jgi:uncharacterized membrane protein
MKISIYFFLTSLLLISCNHSENKTSGSNTPVIAKNDTTVFVKDFSGLLLHNKKLMKFISCDHPELVHLIKNNDQIDSLYKKILPNAYDGESLFLQAQMETSPSDNNTYSDLLTVKKVIKAEQKNPVNTCIPFNFWCKGNEPFWQTEISEKENLIDFYNPMEQRTTHFIYYQPETKNGIIEYVSKGEKNEIKISIKNEKCSDGMSEKTYNYSVEVILNGKKYKGCAMKCGEN